MPLINEKFPLSDKITTATRNWVKSGAYRLWEYFFKHALT